MMLNRVEQDTKIFHISNSSHCSCHSIFGGLLNLIIVYFSYNLFTKLSLTLKIFVCGCFKSNYEVANAAPYLKSQISISDEVSNSCVPSILVLISKALVQNLHKFQVWTDKLQKAYSVNSKKIVLNFMPGIPIRKYIAIRLFRTI